ncbi:MAG: hypothetical protein LBF40_05285 [Deltaproteobacteria bacterium]|nr:hypothetical protein [Deltaproteobacteria bacterium]
MEELRKILNTQELIRFLVKDVESDRSGFRDFLLANDFKDTEADLFLSGRNPISVISRIIGNGLLFAKLIHEWHKRAGFWPLEGPDALVGSHWRKILFIIHELASNGQVSRLATVSDLMEAVKKKKSQPPAYLAKDREDFIAVVRAKVIMASPPPSRTKLLKESFPKLQQDVAVLESADEFKISFLEMAKIQGIVMDAIARNDDFASLIKQQLITLSESTSRDLACFQHSYMDAEPGYFMRELVKNRSQWINEADETLLAILDKYEVLPRIRDVFDKLLELTPNRDEQEIIKINLKLQKLGHISEIVKEVPLALQILRVLKSPKPLDPKYYDSLADLRYGFAKELGEGVYDHVVEPISDIIDGLVELIGDEATQDLSSPILGIQETSDEEGGDEQLADNEKDSPDLDNQHSDVATELSPEELYRLDDDEVKDFNTESMMDDFLGEDIKNALSITFGTKKADIRLSLSNDNPDDKLFLEKLSSLKDLDQFSLTRFIETSPTNVLEAMISNTHMDFLGLLKGNEIHERELRHPSHNHVIHLVAAALLGLVTRLYKNKQYEYLYWLQRLVARLFFQPNLFKALYIGVNYNPLVDDLVNQFHQAINWSTIQKSFFFGKPDMKKIFLGAVAKPTVLAPSKELLQFYRLFSETQINRFSECADILEEYLYETKDVVVEEEKARKILFLQREKDVFLDTIQKVIADFMLPQSFPFMFGKEMLNTLRHLLDAEEGECGTLLASCLKAEDPHAILTKANELALLIEDKSYLQTIHKKLNGDNSIPLNKVSYTKLENCLQNAIILIKQYAESRILSDAVPEITVPYGKYLNKLSEWVDKRQSILGSDRKSLYCDFYDTIKKEISKIDGRMSDPIVQNEGFINFYPWDVDTSLVAYLVIHPEVAAWNEDTFYDKLEEFITNSADDLSIDEGFMQHIKNESLLVPNSFLKVQLNYRGLVPEGQQSSYSEILYASIKDLADKTDLIVDNHLALLSMNYIDFDFTDKDLITLKKATHMLITLKGLLAVASENLNWQGVNTAVADTKSIKKRYLNFTSEHKPYVEPIYFSNDHVFFKILKNNSKKFEQILSPKNKSSSKKQSKDSLRQFFSQVKEMNDFYPKNKEEGSLKELFYALGYNLINKGEQTIKKCNNGTIFKIRDINLKPMTSHYVPTLWNNREGGTQTLILFCGAQPTTWNLMELLQEISNNNPHNQLFVISFSYLDYDFRSEVNMYAEAMGLNLILFDPYLAAYLLMPELAKCRNEAFRRIAAVYGYNDVNVGALTEESYSSDIYRFRDIMPMFAIDDAVPTLFLARLGDDFSKIVAGCFDAYNAQSDNSIKYVYRDVSLEMSLLKVIREELSHIGLKPDISDFDLPDAIRSLFESEERPTEGLVLFLDNADKLLESSNENDFYELILASTIMDLSPSYFKIFFGGQEIVLHHSILTVFKTEHDKLFIKGEGTTSFSLINGNEARDYLLTPLKAFGILFPEEISHSELLKVFNYEPSLIFLFVNRLIAHVRATTPHDSFPPFIVEPRDVVYILDELKIFEKSVHIYVNYLSFNNLHLYVLYTIAYLFYFASEFESKIYVFQILKDLHTFFPGRVDYIDMDELIGVCFDLEQLGFLFVAASNTYKREPIVYGNYYLLQMLGGFEAIEKKINVLRASDEDIQPKQLTWYRRRILRPIDELGLPPEPKYYTLNVSPPDITAYPDYSRFYFEYGKVEGYPSPFSVIDEFDITKFSNLFSYILTHPANGGDRALLALQQFCLLRHFSVVNVRFDKATEFDSSSFAKMLDLMNNLVSRLSQSTNSPIIFFLDFSIDFLEHEKLYGDLLDRMVTYKFDNEPITRFVISMPPDASLSFLLNNYHGLVHGSMYAMQRWTLTSVFHYLRENNFDVTHTKRIIEETNGYDALVLKELAKLKGYHFDLDPAISKPFFCEKFQPVLDTFSSMFEDVNEYEIHQLTPLLVNNPVFKEFFKTDLETKTVLFVQMLLNYALCDVGEMERSGYSLAYIELIPTFASGEIYPCNDGPEDGSPDSMDSETEADPTPLEADSPIGSEPPDDQA